MATLRWGHGFVLIVLRGVKGNNTTSSRGFVWVNHESLDESGLERYLAVY